MIRGLIAFVFLLVCCIVVLGSLSAKQKHASRAGWISDEGCGVRAEMLAWRRFGGTP